MDAESNAGAQNEELDHIARRLSELNTTSGQILLFLSFSIAAAISFLTPSLEASRRSAGSWALRWWIGAIFPAVIGIIPLKEIKHRSLAWYRFLLWKKMVLLCSAIICILIGAVQFFKAV